MALAAHRVAGKPSLARFGVAVAVNPGLVNQASDHPRIGQERLPFIFFFPAVVVAAWYGGLGPGLLAASLGGLAADWYYIGPQHSFGFRSVFDLAALASYTLSCGFILLAMQMMHRAQRRLLAEADQRKIADEKLLDEKELLATTLASIGDAVIATDKNGQITFVNSEAERLTGWTAGELKAAR